MADYFYLGPLTDLQPLDIPDSFDRTPKRLQSVFQGATGRTTANTTGIKRTWQLSWGRGTAAQRVRLEGLQYGFGEATPLRFVDPYGVNLLDTRTASGGASFGTRPIFSTLAVGLSQTLQPGTDIPVSPAPRLMTRIISTSGSAGEASAGWAGLTAPWLSGPVTLSAWVKSPSGGQLKLYAATGDGESFFSGTVGTTTIPSGSTWTRVTVTGTPSAGTKGLYPAVSVPAGATMNVGPIQLELGSAATSWTSGAGGQVVITDYSDGVELFPYSELSITLQEA